jgi:uncharacterized protein (TIGR00730 family)
MKYICIFCSANDLEEKYVEPAKEFSMLLASHGYGLVWGGSDMGLMKVVASTVQEAGAPIIGVSVEFLKQYTRTNATEMTVAKDLGERKRLMIEKSDAFVALTGGVGTLDEISELVELKKQHLHTKPIVLLNTDHFYDGLMLQLERMVKDGFIKVPLDQLVTVCATPQEVIERIDTNVQSTL